LVPDGHAIASGAQIIQHGPSLPGDVLILEMSTRYPDESLTTAALVDTTSTKNPKILLAISFMEAAGDKDVSAVRYALRKGPVLTC